MTETQHLVNIESTKVILVWVYRLHGLLQTRSFGKPRLLPFMMYESAKVWGGNLQFNLEDFAIFFYAAFMYLYRQLWHYTYFYLFQSKVYTLNYFFTFMLFHTRGTIIAENVKNTLAAYYYIFASQGRWSAPVFFSLKEQRWSGPSPLASEDGIFIVLFQQYKQCIYIM